MRNSVVIATVTLLCVVALVGSKYVQQGKNDKQSVEEGMRNIKKIRDEIYKFPEFSNDEETVNIVKGHMDEILSILKELAKTTKQQVFKGWAFGVSSMVDVVESYGFVPMVQLTIDTMLRIWEIQKKPVSDAEKQQRKQVLHLLEDLRQSQVVLNETKSDKTARDTIKKTLADFDKVAEKMNASVNIGYQAKFLRQLRHRAAQAKLDLPSVVFDVKTALKIFETDPSVVFHARFYTNMKETQYLLVRAMQKLQNNEIRLIKMQENVSSYIWRVIEATHGYYFGYQREAPEDLLRQLWRIHTRENNIEGVQKAVDIIGEILKGANDNLDTNYYMQHVQFRDDPELITHAFKNMFFIEDPGEPGEFSNSLGLVGHHIQNVVTATNHKNMLEITQKYIEQALNIMEKHVKGDKTMEIYADRLKGIRKHNMKKVEDVSKAASIINQAAEEVQDMPADYYVTKLADERYNLVNAIERAIFSYGTSSREEKLKMLKQQLQRVQKTVYQLAHNNDLVWYDHFDDVFQNAVNKLSDHNTLDDVVGILYDTTKAIWKLYLKNRELLM